MDVMKPKYPLGYLGSLLVGSVLSWGYFYYLLSTPLAVCWYRLGFSSAYPSMLAALILTALVGVLVVLSRKIFSFARTFWSLAWVFAWLIMMLGVDAVIQYQTVGVGESWNIKSLIAGIVCVIVAGMGYRWMLEGKRKHTRVSMPHLWKEFTLMIIAFWILCLGTSPNKVSLQQMRYEVDIFRSDDVATTHLKNDFVTVADDNLTCLRAYLMAQEGKLGDMFFTYPVSSNVEALLPHGRNSFFLLNKNLADKYFKKERKHGEPIESYLKRVVEDKTSPKSAVDYLLCSYLVDRRLDAFAGLLKENYQLTKLPVHYREALLLYVHLRTNPLYDYKNDVLEADFADFQTMENQYPDSVVRTNKVRDVYGKTYWWYYFYRQ